MNSSVIGSKEETKEMFGERKTLAQQQEQRTDLQVSVAGFTEAGLSPLS